MFKTYKIRNRLLASLLGICLALGGCASFTVEPGLARSGPDAADPTSVTSSTSFDLDSIPDYSGSAWVPVNDNVPYFKSKELTSTSYEAYSELDALGRCQVAVASVGVDLMPTEKREDISSVKPSGWINRKYACLNDSYLYNRCHLIGFQLTGENANACNLITGTAYLNTEGMLPFENMVADYIKETNSHVLYRITPVYSGDELVARGVLMEAMSVEDKGAGIEFCVFCYNVQPGIEIDYATGESWQAETDTSSYTASEDSETYIVNTNTLKFHCLSCPSVAQMKEKNKSEFTGSRSELISRGYSPCAICRP